MIRTALVFAAAAAGSLSSAAEIVIREGLAAQVPGGSRSMLRADPLEDLFVEGKWAPPSEGSLLGSRPWTKVRAGDNGQFTGPFTSSGVLYAPVEVDQDKVMLLEAQGCGMTYVNGVARTGDVYGFGTTSLPVLLKKGRNDLLFFLGQGFLRAKLVEPPAPLSLDPRDATTPDVVRGEGGKSLAALVVRNATGEWQRGLAIEAKVLPGGRTTRTPVTAVLPWGVHKAGFDLVLPKNPEGEKVKVEVTLKKGRATLHSTRLTLRVRTSSQAHKITFRSQIDGSVQYYALLRSTSPGAGQALFLSLHGASVEAIGQAEAYGAKSWGHVVAPTNRRPFGFNWEDIGRLDAMEVLALAEAKLKTDPRRTFVTGHSMGGHGTWHLASHYPDRFAGAAPAAGWVSYWSYAGGARYDLSDPLQAALRQASNPSDTLRFVRNLSGMAVFVLHGDADETVPVSEARTMREALKPFHQDLHWHEEPGQGHWYDTDPEPGANCMDYRPIYDIFARRQIPAPESVAEIDYTTASPRINGRKHWVEIVHQTEPFVLSRVQLKRSLLTRTITGTTTGVRRMKLSLAGMAPGLPVKLDLDGQAWEEKWPENGTLELEKTPRGWREAEALDPEESARRGTWGFKDVLNSKVLLVVGASGDAEENEWAVNQARYHAETFWYIGNGSVEVITDKEFRPELARGRNVLLYGDRNTNSLWDELLPKAEVTVQRGAMTMGRMKDLGSFAVLTSAPKPGEPHLLVGAIGGSDRAGREKAMRLPIFTAGAGVGPWLVLPSRRPSPRS